MTAPVLEKPTRPGSKPPRVKVGFDFPLALERRSATPLHRQLVYSLRNAISRGLLRAGDKLPSSRTLAASLGVSRNVVVLAFEDLMAEGYLCTAPGAATTVNPGFRPLEGGFKAHPLEAGLRRWLQNPTPPSPSDPPLRPGLLEFRLGQPDTSALPLEAWRRGWREVTHGPIPGDYGDPQGHFALREAIAQYLGRSRGLKVDPESVLIVSGCVQALDLLARACLKRGDRGALENPGYRMARAVFEGHGATLLPIEVDGDGLCVTGLPTGENAPLMLYCTPSHQYPLGVRLSVSRRHALLEWAGQNEVLLLEDDYDGEFRYDASPLPALASLDRGGNVVYLGTFSKTLSPALRVGYLVAEPELLERLVGFKRLSDFHSPLPMQQFLADFVGSGELERHIWRMRRIYAHKRNLLEHSLRPISTLAQLSGLEAGLHVLLDLAPKISAVEVEKMALERGVKVSTLGSYQIAGEAQNALLLGYGGLTEAEIVRGAGVLCEVISELARGNFQSVQP